MCYALKPHGRILPATYEPEGVQIYLDGRTSLFTQVGGVLKEIG